MFLLEFRRNAVGRFSGKVHVEDPFDDCSLLRHDLRCTVLALSVSQQALIIEYRPTFFKPLSVSPSNILANLNFLIDIHNNYKYNWNSEKYKVANHAKVLDIRQDSARQIDFYQEQIKKRLGKKSLIYSDQDIQKKLDRIQSEFKEYQLALYIYGFAYFLEVVLQENFDVAYLSAISAKIDGMSFDYRELYSLA